MTRAATAGSVNGAGTTSTTGRRYGGFPGWATRQRARPGSSRANADAVKVEAELGEWDAGRRERVELREQRSLEREVLRRALLDVGCTADRGGQLGVPCHARGDDVRWLVEQARVGELAHAGGELPGRRREPRRVRVVDGDGTTGTGEDDRPSDADRAGADDGDAPAGAHRAAPTAAALRRCARQVVAHASGSLTWAPSTWWIAWLCGAVLTISGLA